MVDNKGNSYRTIQSLTACIVLVGAALAILAYFGANVKATAALGVFVLVLGIAVLAMAPMHSGAPDKFGPGERDYRIAVGAVILIIGILLVMTVCSIDWYWYVAVFIIAVAVIGAAMTIINNKKIKNE